MEPFLSSPNSFEILDPETFPPPRNWAHDVSSLNSPEILEPPTFPPPRNWAHDVFLSFRGEDTRYSFTDHLYYALDKKGFSVYRDTENLQMGESIAPELLEAIENSRFAVVVFSRNYAASTWCLDELAHIAKCKKQIGTQVIPIFYHVEPSELRRQTGNCGAAFTNHEENLRDDLMRVDQWRQALKEICNISGDHVTGNRSEPVSIQAIVDRIFKDLNIYIPNEELVGMDVRVEEIESHLDLTSTEVLTIGIWGMGGIGKTTLADEVFKKIRHQFDLSTFISEVGSKSKIEFQQCLYESFSGKDRSIQHMHTGGSRIELLRKVLVKKKVLIILDDVDSFKNIECLSHKGLLGENILGGGSRLIITTRDRSTLTELRVPEDNIYEVEKLSEEEASQLFCQKAFNKVKSPKEFVELSKSFLQYAGGLPLAHEVLGSYLAEKNADEWSEILDRLDDDPNKGIFGVLQKSFDGLEDTDKKIFLDIACFFTGEDYVRVKNILKGCGFTSGIGINNLIDKSMIKVENNKLWMHGLLQRLGWHIVHKESLSPGKRSRLWVDKHKVSRSYEDACEVLMYNEGTAAIQGFFLSLREREDMSLTGDPSLKMRNLRLLKISNVSFLGVQFGHLSRHLRLLEWHECPLQFLPHNFKWENLVEIKLPNSRIERLQKKSLSLGMLTLMDLSHCQSFTTTPDFSTLLNLETLILQGCNKLSELHSTIGDLQKLKFLNLKGCTSLQRLPQHISMKSLQIFILSGCSKLQKIPEIWENMDTLSELYLDGTTILEVPLSIQNLKGLILLNLSGCRKFLGLPSILCSSLISLRFLYLSLCSSMVKLPDNIGCLERLEELDLCHTAIGEVPGSVSSLQNLKLLCFHGCSQLRVPLDVLPGLTSLTILNLGGCHLEDPDILEEIGSLSSLQSLDLSGNNFPSIPESICHLPELEEISLVDCVNLESLPGDPPASAQNVDIRGCNMLKYCSSSWRKLVSDDGLLIRNCSKWDDRRPLMSLNVKFVEYHETPYPRTENFASVPIIGSSRKLNQTEHLVDLPHMKRRKENTDCIEF